MNTSLFTVPISIEASSRQDLTKLMLVVQSRLKMKVHFFDINFINGKWIAWYELDMKSQMVKDSNADTSE